MKKIIYTLFLISSIYFVSCTPDKKDDPIEPINNTDERDKYMGLWLCTEVSKSLPSTTYTISIGKSSTSTSEIIVNKFYNLATQARLTVSANSVSIPYQNLTTLGFASGTGTLTSNGTILKMNYIVKIASNDNDTCTANCIKQ